MISPRRVIKNNDDKYLKAAAKIIGITHDDLFFELESGAGTINGFSVTKEKSGNNFSYLISNAKEMIRIVCTF